MYLLFLTKKILMYTQLDDTFIANIYQHTQLLPLTSAICIYVCRLNICTYTCIKNSTKNQNKPPRSKPNLVESSALCRLTSLATA